MVYTLFMTSNSKIGHTAREGTFIEKGGLWKTKKYTKGGGGLKFKNALEF